jgi:hypothetical protein
MKKVSFIILFSLAALVPIIANWTCSSCGQDNPEVREICWWCGSSH